jgi:hypothetical protein
VSQFEILVQSEKYRSSALSRGPIIDAHPQPQQTHNMSFGESDEGKSLEAAKEQVLGKATDLFAQGKAKMDKVRVSKIFHDRAAKPPA